MLMKFKQLGIVKGVLSVLAVIGILICAGYGLYHKMTYKSTPEYSLKLIYDAIQNGDEETFNKLVDIEAIGHRRYDKIIAFYEKRIAEGKEKKILYLYDGRMLNMGEHKFAMAKRLFSMDIHTIFTGGDTGNIKYGAASNTRFIDNIVMLREPNRFKLVSVESHMMSPEQVSIVVIGQDMTDNNLKSLSLEMKKISDDEWKIVWYDFGSFGFPDMGRDDD